jgi:hypothetical protein
MKSLHIDQASPQTAVLICGFARRVERSIPVPQEHRQSLWFVNSSSSFYCPKDYSD